jgi:hypothetical protein
MKIRYGFISNSSSTTFTCPACNASQFGWDWEDDPTCYKCGCHMLNYEDTFAQYLIKKYELDEDDERNSYIRSRGNIERDE